MSETYNDGINGVSWELDIDDYEIGCHLIKWYEYIRDNTNKEGVSNEDLAEETRKYIKLIKLQAKQEYGQVMTTEDFIDCVSDGSIMDDDGSGIFIDQFGNRLDIYPGSIQCDVDWLSDLKDQFPYVLWFNK